jgi:hypothetical protein
MTSSSHQATPTRPVLTGLDNLPALNEPLTTTPEPAMTLTDAIINAHTYMSEDTTKFKATQPRSTALPESWILPHEIISCIPRIDHSDELGDNLARYTAKPVTHPLTDACLFEVRDAIAVTPADIDNFRPPRPYLHMVLLAVLTLQYGLPEPTAITLIARHVLDITNLKRESGAK